MVFEDAPEGKGGLFEETVAEREGVAEVVEDGAG